MLAEIVDLICVAGFVFCLYSMLEFWFPTVIIRHKFEYDEWSI